MPVMGWRIRQSRGQVPELDRLQFLSCKFPGVWCESVSSDAVLSVRLGVHTGDVIRDEGDYLGLRVKKAARVAAAADGGQILVS